jgi:predicted anti-sigma-YlaC factor YlaD
MGDLPRWERIHEHLDTCNVCRKLEQELQQVRVPLQKAPRVEAPPGIWQNIRQQIEEERQAEFRLSWEDMKNWLGEAIVIRRPAFALATAMAVLIIVYVLGRNMAFRPYYEARYGQEAFTSILDNRDDKMAADLGTSIEKYFL